MKIKVTMKDPDTMYDAVQDAVKEEVEMLNLPKDEYDALIELRADKEREKLSKWFRYSEYLSVEFDTETMTATVLSA
jgi:hypothetical protein